MKVGDAGLLVRAAIAAGACEAEIYAKTGAGRQVALEPPMAKGSPALVTVSTWDEGGTALRLRDAAGRVGFAWVGQRRLDEGGRMLIEAALASARLGRPDAGGTDAAALAMATHGAGSEAAGPSSAALKIADPECLALSPGMVAAQLAIAAKEAAAEEMVALERMTIREAMTSILLANSRGFEGRYERSLALFTVGLIPAAGLGLESGASAVIEERSACRLADLDGREAVREAVLRALPTRTPIAPPEESPVVVTLAARAAASFLAGMAGWLVQGGNGAVHDSALSVLDDARAPGRPGSAPFDGAGFPTTATVLLHRGRPAGSLTAEGGHWQRPSYRDWPVLGPAGLRILAGQGKEEPPEGQQEHKREVLELRATAIEVTAGAPCRLRIRRAEWWRGGTPLGPADGLVWEGSPQALVEAVTATGEKTAEFHLGIPLAAPALRLQGLGPFVVEAKGKAETSF